MYIEPQQKLSKLLLMGSNY